MERCNHFWLIVSLLCCTLTGCHRGQDYFPRDLEPVSVPVIRFDSALLSVRPDSITQDVRLLYADYEEFMPLFVEGVLGISSTDTAYLCAELPRFLTDTTMGFQQTNQLAEERFSDPDAPMMDTNSPSAMSRLMPRNTCNALGVPGL